MRLDREASVKTNVFVALLFASTLTAGTAAAQPAPFNQIGVTMGHWHIASKDVEANKKLFLAMGGKLYMPGGNPLIMFPGLYINLNLGTEKGDGGTQGSVVNHVGFIVNNVQARVAQWKAAGVTVLPGNNNRLDQAFVETPDGVRIEILEDKTQTTPIRNEHVHLSLPEAEIPKAQAWYAKTFGGKAGTRLTCQPGPAVSFTYDQITEMANLNWVEARKEPLGQGGQGIVTLVRLGSISSPEDQLIQAVMQLTGITEPSKRPALLE